MKRRRHSSKLKSQVALAAIKGDRTANEIASEYGVHVSQVNKWKKEAIDSLPDYFSCKSKRLAKDSEKEKDQLYQQIGKLKVEVDFLKKNIGHFL
jgi:transposase